MKQAGNAEFVIWLIVAVVAMVAKGLGKLATPASQDDAAPAPPPQPAAPKPAPKRPVHRSVPPVAPPVMPPVVAETKPEPSPVPPTETPAPTPVSPAAQWAVALRDRQNVRNIVIGAEIIGPPVSLREM